MSEDAIWIGTATGGAPADETLIWWARGHASVVVGCRVSRPHSAALPDPVDTCLPSHGLLPRRDGRGGACWRAAQHAARAPRSASPHPVRRPAAGAARARERARGQGARPRGGRWPLPGSRCCLLVHARRRPRGAFRLDALHRHQADGEGPRAPGALRAGAVQDAGHAGGDALRRAAPRQHGAQGHRCAASAPAARPRRARAHSRARAGHWLAEAASTVFTKPDVADEQLFKARLPWPHGFARCLMRCGIIAR